MDKEFDNLFSKASAKYVLAFLMGVPVRGLDLNEIAETSLAIMNFDTADENLINNSEFVKAWGILRVKAEENIKLIKTLLLLKRKYKISDFDFNLLLEDFDEENII